MYLFTAVKMTLRVGTSVKSMNANTHNVSYLNSTQMIFKSIILYVPVWSLTALNVLQSTLSKDSEVWVALSHIPAGNATGSRSPTATHREEAGGDSRLGTIS